MAKASVIPRPTEAAAIGHLQPRTLPALNHLYETLAVTVRRHDSHGARMTRYLLVRTMAAGEVGER